MYRIGERVVTTVDHQSVGYGGKIMRIPKGTLVTIGYRFTSESTEDKELYNLYDPVTGNEIYMATTI